MFDYNVENEKKDFEPIEVGDYAVVLSAEEKPTREMKKLLKEIKNIEDGKSKLYDNLDELWKDLKI